MLDKKFTISSLKVLRLIEPKVPKLNRFEFQAQETSKNSQNGKGKGKRVKITVICKILFITDPCVTNFVYSRLPIR